MQKHLIVFYAKKESLQISQMNLQTRTQSAERIAYEKRLIAVMSCNNKTVTRLVVPGR